MFIITSLYSYSASQLSLPSWYRKITTSYLLSIHLKPWELIKLVPCCLNCALLLCSPLSLLFQRCIDHSCIPSEWKIHLITPLFKKVILPASPTIDQYPYSVPSPKSWKGSSLIMFQITFSLTYLTNNLGSFPIDHASNNFYLLFPSFIKTT